MNTKLKKLTSSQEMHAAENAFFKVFKSSDTSSDPFQTTVEEKIILYNELYGLDEEHYYALGEIAQYLYNSNTAFLSVIEGLKDKAFPKDRSWTIDLGNYLYTGLSQAESTSIALLQTAIYSIDGLWGIVFSEYGHAIMGGSHLFIKSFKKKIPELQNEVFDFLADVKEESILSPRTKKYFRKWLPELLSNIYGRNEALELQKKVGLDLAE